MSGAVYPPFRDFLSEYNSSLHKPTSGNRGAESSIDASTYDCKLELKTIAEDIMASHSGNDGSLGYGASSRNITVDSCKSKGDM